MYVENKVEDQIKVTTAVGEFKVQKKVQTYKFVITGEKPDKCNHCGKSFKKNGAQRFTNVYILERSLTSVTSESRNPL